ncbi:MAG: FkbM family methyltransferase [Planctomycetes bacterium]|nr:FkbM family methyltransferase [Planctomycetota bacterium]
MRPEDIQDYFKLRRFATNPWEIVRFRKGQRRGKLLEVKMRNGPPLFIRGGRTDFHIFHRIFLRDEYRVSAQPPQSWNCVVDLGANVGILSTRASLLARRVISYEPFPGNFAQLRKNVDQRTQVTAVQEAVAGEPGSMRLFRPRNDAESGSYSSFAEESEALSETFDEVTAVTLDQIFEDHKIDCCDLLKMDVEGQEYEILHAAGDATWARIDRIHGEYHNVRPEDPRTRIDHFKAFLQSKGFVVETVPHRRKPNHGMFYAQRNRKNGE